jgi:hypothetical protein
MTVTPHLALPLIAAAQAQKHVTHNEAITALDALVHLAVIDRDLSLPPATPAEGDRYIVAGAGTGAWAGKGGQIALWQDGMWRHFAPSRGFLGYVLDEGVLVAWSGTAWIDALSAVSAFQNLALLGLGTSADPTNPFSAKLNKALWAAKTLAEGGTGDLRYTMNKEAAAKTLSLLLQSGFSGRAEIGLTGDDDLHVKVSPDGAAWTEALKVNRSTGFVSFPAMGGPREVLSANRTYYVRTDGSDANNGLANTAGGAFLTVQKAIDTVAAIDLSSYAVTIQMADGTYSGPVTFKAYVGAGPVTIQGNTGTPSNVVLNSTSGHLLEVGVTQKYALNGVKVQTSGGSYLPMYVRDGAHLELKNFVFGASGFGAGLYLSTGSSVDIRGPITIAASMARWAWIEMCAQLNCFNQAFTITGSPTFSEFVNVTRLGVAVLTGNTYTGAATGMQYSVSSNAVLVKGGDVYPGNAAGTSATGAQVA